MEADGPLCGEVLGLALRHGRLSDLLVGDG